MKPKICLFVLTGILCLLACLYTSKVEDSQTFTRPASTFTSLTLDTRNGAITATANTDTLASVKVTRYAYGRNKTDATNQLNGITITDTVSAGNWSLTANFPAVTKPMGALMAADVPANTRLNILTSNGDVTVSGIAAPISVATSNGDVILTGTSGDAEISTSNAKVIVQVHSGGIDINTSNGEIDCDLSFLPATSGAELATSNGKVTLRLPPDVSAYITATTSNGTVVITGYQVHYDENTQKHIKARIGSGASPITITTSNGDIVIQNRVR
ncbi:MAG: DUF4097 family beta strand repeat-containing protein [candidate division WOR-3 bacterium]